MGANMGKRLGMFLLLFGLISLSAVPARNVSWFGIVRSDGLMIPFAQFDGLKWRLCWPEADSKDGQKTIELSAIPKAWLGSLEVIPNTWKFLSSDHRISELNLGIPIKTASYCGDIWGITTNYSPAKKVEHSWPYPKAGLAFIGDLNVKLPEQISLTSRDSEHLRGFIREVFEEKEDGISRKDPAQAEYGEVTRGDIPLLKELRRKNEISTSVLMKVGANAYYFECRRVYPASGEGSQQDFLNINGWILEDRDTQNYRLIDINMIRGVGFSPSVFSYKVLGQLAIDNALYVITVEDYYEWEFFTILRINDDGLETIVQARAGSC
jgi:hypothetical protein